MLFRREDLGRPWVSRPAEWMVHISGARPDGSAGTQHGVLSSQPFSFQSCGQHPGASRPVTHSHGDGYCC